jgi:hypothetical protein
MKNIIINNQIIQAGHFEMWYPTMVNRTNSPVQPMINNIYVLGNEISNLIIGDSYKITLVTHQQTSDTLDFIYNGLVIRNHIHQFTIA